MNKTKSASDIDPPSDGIAHHEHTGIEHQHILIKVHVATYNRIIQYDDTCAHLLTEGLKEYKGAVCISAEPMYDHCNEDLHVEGCECWKCNRARDLALKPAPAA